MVTEAHQTDILARDKPIEKNKPVCVKTKLKEQATQQSVRQSRTHRRTEPIALLEPLQRLIFIDNISIYRSITI